MSKSILLTSPDFIRLNSNISDNLNSKVLTTAIREVQDNELQEVIGQKLLEKLQSLVEDGSISDIINKPYKDALDKAQLFITYKVISEVILKVNCKIDNAGLIITSDEHMEPMELKDALVLKSHYDKKSAHYCYLLQNYLLEHRAELPELTQYQAWKIQSTLYSAATPSVFLGGPRGKGYYKIFPYRYQYGANFPNK